MKTIISGVVKEIPDMRAVNGGTARTIIGLKAPIDGVFKTIFTKIPAENIQSVRLELKYVWGFTPTISGGMTGGIHVTKSSISPYGSITRTSSTSIQISTKNNKILQCVFNAYALLKDGTERNFAYLMAIDRPPTTFNYQAYYTVTVTSSGNWYTYNYMSYNDVIGYVKNHYYSTTNTVYTIENPTKSHFSNFFALYAGAGPDGDTSASQRAITLVFRVSNMVVNGRSIPCTIDLGDFA